MVEPTPTDTVFLFTDGACKGNPGPGGWGALLVCSGNRRELFGGEPSTTNNRMEILAVIEGLSALKRASKVVVTTDSVYVKDGITKWIHGWRRNGWRTASRQPVKNVDLWQRLDSVVALHDIEWKWVKGHTGHRENEIADRLANRGVESVLGGRRAPTEERGGPGVRFLPALADRAPAAAPRAAPAERPVLVAEGGALKIRSRRGAPTRRG